jgi:nicotinamide-nucleotide amidase
MRKPLVIEILAVGSELLSPYFQDTNSLFLTEKLNDLGLEVNFKSIAGDDWKNLSVVIQDALNRSDLIISIGGLGPTHDDLTREVFASVLGKNLVFQKDLYKKIQARFKRRGRTIPQINKKQAFIIDGAQVIKNNNGTAPGLWLETKNKIIILLPGPPHEIKPMFDEFVLPRLQKFRKIFTAHRVIRTTGMPESRIETLISDIYPENIFLNLTTLAKPGQIDLLLTAKSTENQESADTLVSGLSEKIKSRLGDIIFTFNGEHLETVVGSILRVKKSTLAVAESCTGGLLGHRITNIAGSSDYFLQGTIVYSNESKSSLLGINPDLILKHGAVSPEVAKAMAEGIRLKARSDFGLSITGIAGPGGGSPDKPVGLVYTALSWEGGIQVEKNSFLGDRHNIKLQASQKSLDMLRRHLVKSL